MDTHLNQVNGGPNKVVQLYTADRNRVGACTIATCAFRHKH